MKQRVWGRTLARLRYDKVAGHGGNEVARVGRNWNRAAEHLAEGKVASVLRLHIVVVVVEDRAVKGDTGEEALRARIGEELGVELPVSAGLGVTADGTCRRRSISANLELVLQHVLKALLVHRDQNQVGSLSADLPAEAAAGELDENRSAPAARCAAGSNALAVLCADNEGALLVARDDDDAGGAGKDRGRNALVGSRHDLLNHVGSTAKPLIQLVHVRSTGRDHARQHRKSAQHTQKFLHLNVPFGTFRLTPSSGRFI